MLFISHDLAVVSQVADRVAVMYAGYLVEMGMKQQIFRAPVHPYTPRFVVCRPHIRDGPVSSPGNDRRHSSTATCHAARMPLRAALRLPHRRVRAGRPLPPLIEVGPGLTLPDCPVVAAIFQ